MFYRPKSNLLNNRIILVTGASDGIGREASIVYARYGARVILLGRNVKKLQRVSDEIVTFSKVSPMIQKFDLAIATSVNCRNFASLLAKQVPCLDGLLHNAGYLGTISPFANLAPAVWKKVMRINLDATFYLTQALLPLLLKSESGSLVFTSSSVGRVGRAGWGAYSVSKFATEGMMQVLAEEYKDCSLRVNCINPGRTRTKMRASAFPKEDASKLKPPSEIMPIYLYLMSDDSRNKTGISFDAQIG